MTPRQAIITLYSRQGDFAGRSPRSEAGWGLVYGGTVVMGCLAPLVAVVAPRLFGMAPDPSGAALAYMEVIGAMAFWALLTVKPLAALLVRRLHDLNRPAMALVVVLIPVAGLVVLILWLCQRGTPGPNRFGPDPLA